MAVRLEKTLPFRGVFKKNKSEIRISKPTRLSSSQAETNPKYEFLNVQNNKRKP